jgi:hypothetical protein
MIKKKAGRETAGNSVAKKRVSKAKGAAAAQVYERIAAIVRAAATEIAQALIDRARNGDPAAAKYLFDLAAIFPSANDPDAGDKEEDSLAKTLMHRLNLPEEPIKMDEEEDATPGVDSRKDDGDDDARGEGSEAIKNP